MTIDRLVMVAGPTCAGKTTFVNGLLSGRWAALSHELGIEDPSHWNYVNTRSLHTHVGSEFRRIVLEYDFLRPWKEGTYNDYRYDLPLSVLHAVKEITFVTLSVDSGVLLQRLRARRPRRTLSLLLRRGVRRAVGKYFLYRRIEGLYTKSEDLGSQYRMWFEFCDGFQPRKHCIVDTSAPDPLLRRDLHLDNNAGADVPARA